MLSVNISTLFAQKSPNVSKQTVSIANSVVIDAVCDLFQHEGGGEELRRIGTNAPQHLLL